MKGLPAGGFTLTFNIYDAERAKCKNFLQTEFTSNARNVGRPCTEHVVLYTTYLYLQT